jgi:hypothetical protein
MENKKENIQETNCKEEIIKNKNICNYNNCKRKIKITDIECKCKNIFCKFHKFPEDHNCDYNYNSEEIKKKCIESLKCTSNKIQKII